MSLSTTSSSPWHKALDPVQKCRRVLQYGGEAVPVITGSHTQSSSQQNQGHYDRALGLGAITSIGHHGLDHPVPLGQNSLTSPRPLSRTSQTVLVGGGGAEHYTECHSGVCEKQPENTGSHAKLVCYLIHVVDKVNLDGVPWTGYVPETESCVKTTCLTKPPPSVDLAHRNTF